MAPVHTTIITRSCATLTLGLLGALLLVGCGGDVGAVPGNPMVSQPAPDSGPPPSCDDGNPCTQDLMDPDTRECTHPKLAVGSSCSDGKDCTFDDACNAQGQCQGQTITCVDDPAPCGPRRTCNGTSQCAETFPDSQTACTGGCLQGAHCDGQGGCVGGTTIPCASDACHRRECDTKQGKCVTVENHGIAVYEKEWGESWTYSFSDNGGKIVFRVLRQDITLHVLEAPGLDQRMMSRDPHEANQCFWCGCSQGPDGCTDCAFQCKFHDTGEAIHTSALPQEGTVPLRRFVDTKWSRIRHRESVVDLGPNWKEEGSDHGFVCAPE